MPNLAFPDEAAVSVAIFSPKLFVCAECIETFPEVPVDAYVSPFGFRETDHAAPDRLARIYVDVRGVFYTQGSESCLVRAKLSKLPTISPFSRFQSFVRPSMLLYSALLPSGETDNETWASECGVGNIAFGGCGWPPVEENCFTEPSAEAEMTVSFSVHATPQIASEWARRQDERADRQ